MSNKKIAIIGGGASGCFCAVNILEMNPNADVTIYESGLKPLHKLSITGGGRCNVTNTFEGATNLQPIYPRGHQLLKKLFHEFGPNDAYKWFQNHGIPLFVQDDYRVFPKSNKASDICEMLVNQINRKGGWIFTGRKITSITRSDNGKFVLTTSNPQNTPAEFDIVVVAAGGNGGNPMKESIKNLGVEYENSSPSLFSFKIKSNLLTSMMGIAVTSASAMIPGQKFKGEGGMIVTHFGFSGPAILKLSSYAAKYLAANNYKCDVLINWLNISEQELRQMIEKLIFENQKKNVATAHPYGLTQRLWEYLLQRAEIDPNRKYSELGKKNVNKLINTLLADIHHVSGRGQMGEEFVTCGGVSLNSVSAKTLEAKNVPGLFFTGEYLDIDAITGGFNLQNCWTTGYVVAKTITNFCH